MNQKKFHRIFNPVREAVSVIILMFCQGGTPKVIRSSELILLSSPHNMKKRARRRAKLVRITARPRNVLPRLLTSLHAIVATRHTRTSQRQPRKRLEKPRSLPRDRASCTAPKQWFLKQLSTRDIRGVQGRQELQYAKLSFPSVGRLSPPEDVVELGYANGSEAKDISQEMDKCVDSLPRREKSTSKE